MELGTKVSTPCWYQRRRIAAGLCAFFLGVAATAYFSKSSSAPIAPHGVQLVAYPLSMMSGEGPKRLKEGLRRADAEYNALRGNATTPMVLESSGYTTHCYRFTGGTCAIFGCSSWRHASCEWHWSGHVCVCPEGMCTGSDGECYAGDYKKLATGVKIKNVKWPDYSLYFPKNLLLSQLRASSVADENGYDNLFDIYLVPGQMNGQTTVLMSSTSQPDYVISVDQGLPYNLKVDMWKIDRFFRDIQSISTVLCHPHGEAGQYELGTLFKQLPTMTGTTTAWWYMTSMTGGLVWGWVYGDPNEAGYWTFDPPIANALSGTHVGNC